MSLSQLWKALETVMDPEIPVLTLIDIGVIRSAEIRNGVTHVEITPTYSGCPAMQEMEKDIEKALKDAGFAQVSITTVLSPAWTNDSITEKGRKALLDYGIAPPEQTTADKSVLQGHPRNISCPRCRSTTTEMVSQFGSTPCKALYRCKECLEPFDYFKCI